MNKGKALAALFEMIVDTALKLSMFEESAKVEHFYIEVVLKDGGRMSIEYGEREGEQS